MTKAINGAANTVRIGRTTFEATLTSRNNALSAGADQLATRIFAKAEEQFRKAAITFENGKPDKAQTQAVEAVQSYRDRGTRRHQGCDPARCASAARTGG